MSEIEGAIGLIQFLHDRLRYLQPTVGSLVDAACAVEHLGKIPYLTECRAALSRGEPFPRSWRGAVERRAGALGAEEASLLATLGDVLGATDLDSQLASLNCVKEGLEHRLELARRDRERYHKLYGTLGVLAGLAVAILVM